MVGESIYTLKLRQQNIAYYAGVELQRAHALTVAQAMRSDVPAVPATGSVIAALAQAAALNAGLAQVLNMPIVLPH